MNRFVVNAGSTATPNRPRSRFPHVLLDRFNAGVASRMRAAVRTLSTPGCVVISMRASGVKASAVGEGTVVTNSSTNPAGSVTTAATAGDDAVTVAGTATATSAIAAAIRMGRDFNHRVRLATCTLSAVQPAGVVACTFDFASRETVHPGLQSVQGERP